MAEGLKQTASSPQLQAALQRAMEQLDMSKLSEMSKDQVAEVQNVLQKLLEPYRQGDQDEAKKCLTAQGGLEKCSLAFYTDNDIGGDKVWDNWRLEGPSFVWYFRGSPHVHVWVNVADDPLVKLNA